MKHLPEAGLKDTTALAMLLRCYWLHDAYGCGEDQKKKSSLPCCELRNDT